MSVYAASVFLWHWMLKSSCKYLYLNYYKCRLHDCVSIFYTSFQSIHQFLMFLKFKKLYTTTVQFKIYFILEKSYRGISFNHNIRYDAPWGAVLSSLFSFFSIKPCSMCAFPLSSSLLSIIIVSAYWLGSYSSFTSSSFDFLCFFLLCFFFLLSFLFRFFGISPP